MSENFYSGKFRLGRRVRIKYGFWVSDGAYIAPAQEGIIQKINSEAIMPITYNIDINSSVYSKADRIFNIPEYMLEEI